jgi:NADH:ubiquinone oxidoreductase subunit 6 (subunit J)
MFKPRKLTVGVHPAVSWLATGRTVGGIAFMLVLYTAYVDQGAAQLAQDQWTKGVFTIFVALGAVIIGIAVFARLTEDRAMRSDLLRRAFTRPPTTLLCLLLAWGFMILWGSAVGFFNPSEEMTGPKAVGFLIGMFFMVPFQVRALFLVGRDIFSAAEVHPLLPSVLAPCIAWTMTIIDFIFPGPLPSTVAVVVSIAGPSTVTVISVIEGRLLRKLEGVTIRGGPYPARALSER